MFTLLLFGCLMCRAVCGIPVIGFYTFQASQFDAAWLIFFFNALRKVLLELAESQKLEHESELGTCGGDSAVLQKEVQVPSLPHIFCISL